jgi:hypothetical protein
MSEMWNVGRREKLYANDLKIESDAAKYQFQSSGFCCKGKEGHAGPCRVGRGLSMTAVRSRLFSGDGGFSRETWRSKLWDE